MNLMKILNYILHQPLMLLVRMKFVIYRPIQVVQLTVSILKFDEKFLSLTSRKVDTD